VVLARGGLITPARWHLHAIVLHDEKSTVTMACVVVVVPGHGFYPPPHRSFTTILCRLITEVERDLDAMAH
jgi:hypothetical protein